MSMTKSLYLYLLLELWSFGMDMIESHSSRRPSIRPCNCYRVAYLTEAILDSTQIANFKDKYVLGERLGLGQFGIIRSCSDKLTGELFACKSITKERLVTELDVSNVKLEIEIMTRLSGHPNVVELKAVYEEEDYVHLVMELCEGGELFEQLEEHGRFSEEDARGLFHQVMKAVVYCHEKGIIHRDLKPENILLATKSSSSTIKVADFGLAAYIKPGETLRGMVGSPFYIAPEVLCGGYNQAVDVWSAGVILYILLGGTPPFWGNTKSRIFHAIRTADLQFPSDPWDHISSSAKELITGMLCVDVSKRLTAVQVLAHSWMREYIPNSLHSQRAEDSIPVSLAMNNGSFSAQSASGSWDYSSSDDPHIIKDVSQLGSLSSTFRSSSPLFRVSSNSPRRGSARFCFSSCCKDIILELSSPSPSMPSFTFPGPGFFMEPRNDFLTLRSRRAIQDEISKESSFGYFHNSDEVDPSIEVRTTMTAPRRLHTKRNRTIGHGEISYLAATETLIHWESCSRVLGAQSLGQSLFC